MLGYEKCYVMGNIMLWIMLGYGQYYVMDTVRLGVMLGYGNIRLLAMFGYE